jgi:hypothetical protein
MRIRILPTFHFDADPDPAFHFDPDPGPNPAFHLEPGPDPAFHFDGIRILVFTLIRIRVRILLFTLMRMASQNGADPDPQHWSQPACITLLVM